MSDNYFDGVTTEQLRDMTKMSIRGITEMRWKFRNHEDVTAILEEQAALLLRNVELSRNFDALRQRVKRGEIADFVAAFQCGGISAAARQNHEIIILNGKIIEMLLDAKMSGRRIEA
jgi:hypothetical protein